MGSRGLSPGRQGRGGGEPGARSQGEGQQEMGWAHGAVGRGRRAAQTSSLGWVAGMGDPGPAFPRKSWAFGKRGEPPPPPHRIGPHVLGAWTSPLPPTTPAGPASHAQPHQALCTRWLLGGVFSEELRAACLPRGTLALPWALSSGLPDFITSNEPIRGQERQLGVPGLPVSVPQSRAGMRPQPSRPPPRNERAKSGN